MTHHHASQQSRRRRIRAVIRGTSSRPRLAVFRSLKYINAQLIDDRAGKTLIAVYEKQLTGLKGDKTARAAEVGQKLAMKAKAAKIEAVVFDRGGYQYHGRVKALADGARAGGLKF